MLNCARLARAQFAVRPETHSPHLPSADMTIGDLARRCADAVPRKHTVRLVEPKKTALLMIVADCAMLSVVEDWHALHKFNVSELRKEAEQHRGAAEPTVAA